ncbi:hypothetical protein SLEP1_g1693 [Rubroshorea leprosula]|uniref:Gag1-like clamp domain-containing protein n=1 Tax=Rubroshorea leprosula TaxID=152421 RepID=A0AAV5HKI6_9ROSI|nr:hypothetical protein SLEP1_g1693 [Rubroshorea leprosula]
MLVSRHLPTWILPFFECTGSCFGCFGKDTVITEVDEPSKRGKVQRERVKKSTIYDDFWSTSAGEIDAGEIDDSVFPSQPSISSISISNQPPDPSGSTSNPSEFVNQGLLLWNQTRQQWLASKRSEKQTELQESRIRFNCFHCFPDTLCIPFYMP